MPTLSTSARLFLQNVQVCDLISARLIFLVLAIRRWILSFRRRIAAVILFYRWTGRGRRRLLAIRRRRIGVGRRRNRLIAINGWWVGVHDGRWIVAVRRRIIGIGCWIAITAVLPPPVADLLNRDNCNLGTTEAWFR